MLAYIFRNYFRRMVVLDFLADISYPLYVLHPLLGYTLLKIAANQGMPFGLAVGLVTSVVLYASWVVHKTIESASIKLGKRESSATPLPFAEAA